MRENQHSARKITPSMLNFGIQRTNNIIRITCGMFFRKFRQILYILVECELNSQNLLMFLIARFTRPISWLEPNASTLYSKKKTLNWLLNAKDFGFMFYISNE